MFLCLLLLAIQDGLLLRSWSRPEPSSSSSSLDRSTTLTCKELQVLGFYLRSLFSGDSSVSFSNSLSFHMFNSVEKRSKMKWKSSKIVMKWNEVKWNEVKWSEVQCTEMGKNETLWEKFIWLVKWWEVKGWGESVSTICVGKNTRNCVQCFLTLVLFAFHTCCILRRLVYIVVSCLVCIVVVVLCVLL